MGPEYFALAVTALTAGISGGAWTANKILSRAHERVRQLSELVHQQESKVENFEQQLNRLPLDYVLKVDFLREIQQMHDNFKQINSKLDRMMDRLLK